MRTLNKIVVDLLSANHITPNEAEMLLNSQNNLSNPNCTYPSCYCKPDWTYDLNRTGMPWWGTIPYNTTNTNDENS